MFLKPVRALAPPIYRPNCSKCCCLNRYTMGLQCPRRELSHLGQRRQGLQGALMRWLSGLRSRYCMWRLRRLLGHEFDEFDFLIGARQAATQMIEAVHQANWSRIRSCCTDQGACAIYGLTQSQRNIQYTKLVRFECQHLCHVTPMSVQRQTENGRKYVYVDIVFVGLRDMRDFATYVEQQEMLQQIKDALQQSQIPEQIAPTYRRIVLGEFLLTLRKELTEPEAVDKQGWLVHFYKVYGFKLVNYSPVTLQYRVIEFLKPV